MKVLDRYVAATVVSGTGVALLVVVGMDVFFSVISQIDEVGKGGYTLYTMLQYVALITPQGAYELFPMAALLGSLVGMGMLAANSELVAMRAAGISVWRIVQSVLQAGALLLVVAVFIGEVVAPAAEQHGQQLRASATNKRVSFLGSHGLWVRDEQSYINAGKVLADDTLAELEVYRFDGSGRLAMATRAARARYVSGAWVLNDVYQSAFVNGRVEIDHLDKVAWPSLLTPELLGIVVQKPKNMSAMDIKQFVGYLDENGLDSIEYRYAFWGRFMTPLATLVMLFISVPFVFGGLRSVAAGQRIFVGILVGFGFYLVSQICSQLGQVYNLNPVFAMLTPIILFTGIGLRAMRRL
ncbi:MAG TPA: LPS export ABC transporter permease LptG [Gammaproteobacteria bacterium]|nr:LPS export ABC transporter permease LptG [Gammaproteobacteria bacterium]